MMTRIVQLFPLWALLLACVAYSVPAVFVPGKQLIMPLLSLVMLSMGMTLRWEDFREVLRQPGVIALGLACQYAVMPLLAFMLAYGLHLSETETIGLILVGTSAGGTASNVMCYLARANVALSVSLTLASTLCAVFAMPALTYLYLHQSIDVPALNMLGSIVQIVLMPVLLGTALNSYFSQWLQKIIAVLPLFSVFAIVFIIAIIVALNANNIGTLGPALLSAIILHNACGLAAGYCLPKLLHLEESTCRTLSLEVGMQNSGLSVALAMQYFSATAALPGAVFSIWHNVSGSTLAAVWRRRTTQAKPEK